jgi:hypothetical protein
VKHRKNFAALSLLVQKSPFNFAVVTGIENMFGTRYRLTVLYDKKYVQLQGPRSIANDYYYF